MRITNISINIDKEHKIIAFVNITLDDQFVIRGIRITEKSDGSRLMSMPSRQNKAGEYVDVCFPITQQFRQQMEKVVMSKIDGLVDQGNGITENPR